MRLRTSLALCLLGTMTLPAQAQGQVQLEVQGQALARQKACLGCHLVDKKRVGPAFVDISNRYASGADATNYVALSIRRGGRGKWGAVPMPAQPQVTEQEALVLARWILSLKQSAGEK